MAVRSRISKLSGAKEAWLLDGVRRLVREANPERVILFGSYVYGEPNNDSDLDLLIVLPNNEFNLAHRQMKISHYFEPRQHPLDLIVLTQTEFQERLNDWFDPFLQEVVHRGQVLYERGSRGRARLGAQS